jgi:hypothetical protein
MNIRMRISTGIATIAAGMALAATPALAAAVPPVVTAEATSNITKTSATLHGAVNPKGTSVTACEFEYGPFEGFYPEAIPCAEALPLSGTSSVPVSAAFTGLSPSTTYYFQLSATNANGTSQGPAQSFTTLPAVDGVTTLAATSIASRAATLNGSLEPNGLDAHYFFEYGPDASYGFATTIQDAGTQSEPKALSAALVGLTPNATYHFRLVGENSTGTTYGVDETLLTSAVQPVVEQFGSTVAVTRGSALLAITANSEHSPTEYLVEYGTGIAYGSRSAPANRSASGAETIDIALEDLTPATLYHYRLVASNPAGTVVGPDETFTTAAATPPLAATGGTSGAGQNTATITGTVNPQGEDTSYGFEIGTGSGYGQPTGLGTVSAGEETIALALSGLQPGTTYHYRVIASNQDGTAYGADQAFTTAGVAVALTVPPAPPLIATPVVAFPKVKATTIKPKPKPKSKKAKKKATKKKAKKAVKAKKKGNR